MTRLRGLSIIGVFAALLFAIPMVAFAQTQGPSYCNLITPTVRDVVQDAPAIAAVLNLDASLPDQQILDQRTALGCGDLPAQTPDQARGEVCAVLTEEKVEALVKEINDPNATKGLETVRPALGVILSTSQQQLNCVSAPAPAAPAATATPAPVGAAPAADVPVPNKNQDIVWDKDENPVLVDEVANDRDCTDYVDQAGAQARLDKDQTDPFNLDIDGNGTACDEKLADPFGKPAVVAVPNGYANTGDGSTLKV